MPKAWRFAVHDAPRVRALAAELDVPPLVAQVLLARGFTSGNVARDFLGAKLMDLHEPERLPGVPEAADRIVKAIADGRRITIYGDYDVDGVTATSLLWHCLKLANATVDYYIPHRIDEGYGLNQDAIRELAAEDPGRLLITVDCGIGSVAEAALARELGLELIVTDHHRFADSLPEAACLVHPRLPDSDYPFADLCGCGVAFKLAWAICLRLGDGKKASPPMREFLLSAVGLAAIATIADVVPLLGENRVLVRYGLSSLPERSNPGLKALMAVSGIEPNGALDTEDIGFKLAPRINAAGRLGQARLAVELLTTDSTERADALAAYLDELNNNRKTVERRILRAAKEQVEANSEWQQAAALVLADEEWHAGVIGIVASRVAERFGKPTVLISISRHDRQGSGSGRSFGSYDLHAGLSACSEHLLSFGGHRAAAGFKIDAESIPAFREALAAHAAEHVIPDDPEAGLAIDAEVRLADLSFQAVRALDLLGPFGNSNPRPLFVASRVELAEPPKKMGGGEQHLSLTLRNDRARLRAVAFGRAEWADQIKAVDGPISVCFAPLINRFRGRESVQLMLVDWKPGE